MLQETSFQIINIYSAVKTVLQSFFDNSYSRGCVNQMWILQNSKDLLSTYEQGPSPPAIALKHLTSLPSTNCAPFLADLFIYLYEAYLIQ